MINSSTLNENQNRSTHAKGTVCTISPMSDELDLLGTCKAAIYIMKGTYKPPVGVDDGIMNILSHLKCPPEIKLKVQPDPITYEEYRVG